MAKVRIYVEGGGDGEQGKTAVRQAFSALLREFEGTMPQVIACGGRGKTYEAFCIGVRDHSDEFVMLLVDAEGAVTQESRRDHLKQQDNWDLSRATEDQVHLMVQAVEAWLIAERTALVGYYRQKLNAKSLPRTANPEDIPKDTLKGCLKRATGDRGYHEIHDCPKVLAKLDPALLRGRCQRAREFFQVLCAKTEKAALPVKTR